MEPRERLKEEREAMGLKQLDFGVPLGLSQANIRDIESGKVKFSTLHALAIENVYEISSEWLLTGVGPKRVRDHSGNKNIKTEEPVADIGLGAFNITRDRNIRFGVQQPEKTCDRHEEYSDPVAQAFLKDWLSLSDVVKMRVWTLVKEELEKIRKMEG